MWISDFREAHGLELDEFARVVNTYRRLRKLPMNGIVSDVLIYILERDERAVTHPILASAIADACGATPEQYDSIVAECHRGKWKPNPANARYVRKAMWKVTNTIPTQTQHWKVETEEVVDSPRPRIKERYLKQCRSVLAIDKNGDVVCEYPSLKAAAEAYSVSEKYVSGRCRRIVRDTSIYKPGIRVTFRYSDEWEKLMPEQRAKEVN